MHLDLIYFFLTRNETKILSKISLCFCREVSNFNQTSLIDPSYFYHPLNQIISEIKPCCGLPPHADVELNSCAVSDRQVLGLYGGQMKGSECALSPDAQHVRGREVCGQRPLSLLLQPASPPERRAAPELHCCESETLKAGLQSQKQDSSCSWK